MQRRISLGMLLDLGLLISGAGRPEPALSEKPCSLQTLKGTYLYHCAGVYLVNGQPVHFAFAGKDQYNGDGTMSGVYSLSDNGTLSQHITYSGTYAVNPDCTRAFTTTDANGVVQHVDLYFGRDGEEVTFVIADPGFVDSGVERRVGR